MSSPPTRRPPSYNSPRSTPFCEEQRVTRLDAVKCDVEGFEERVLLGGRRTLRRWRPVLLLELEPARLRDKQTSAERVALLLQELGYALYVSRRRTLEPLRRLPEGDDAQVNVFCFPQTHAVSNDDGSKLRHG